MSLSGEMYREHILDHYKNPRNQGALEDADVEHDGDNPLCGDQIKVQLKLGSDGRVEDARFSGKGCAISQAAASMFTEWAKGKTLEDIEERTAEDQVEMMGIRLSPVRVKCAILSLMVAKGAIQLYRATQEGEAGDGS
jgi:nitrogen fixation NifU-like protein